MFRLVQSFLICVALTACCSHNKKTKNMDELKNENTNLKTDTTPKVTGIGGVFFFSDNPQDTRDWYAKNLGLEFNDWGSSGFDTRDINHPDEINSLQWTLFKTGNEYFAPSKKEFMINYRVQNLEGLLSKLKANGVTILDDVTTYDFGKFVHIMDADGNKIELWEPVFNND